jgi:hypothetical protein
MKNAQASSNRASRPRSPLRTVAHNAIAASIFPPSISGRLDSSNLVAAE